MVAANIFVYGSDYLLIENIRALLKFNDDLIEILNSFNNTSNYIKIKNVLMDGEGQFHQILLGVVVFIECVSCREIYSIDNNLREGRDN